ncbi:GPI mannosyltransferase 2 [Kalmanozyma brasiliensis GHG001]|uniref:GPI mannosyltransferase 2 n=1 Tax=Kalmanozyma brasiliensis (strain GHG001) TaxID=1365824 RepID=UPI001CE9C363|nr:GPI mannosyltransferase 2 [Kalmanozyma brasiliensis GHG001]KAF6767042.1 GPI mannosyltransferase 2 [Kalmanozyma brasiliensis GHG001]
MVQRRSGSSQPVDPASSQQHSADAKNDSLSSRKVMAAQARLLRLSFLVRIALASLLILTAHLQQAFDTSHELLSYSLDPATTHSLSAGPFKWALAFVRWDTIYFLAAASPSTPVHRGGYAWEQTLAFQPGIIGLLRVCGYATPQLDGAWSPTAAILVTALLANLAAAISPVLLYRLSLKVTRNAEMAYTAAALSIFAPSAGTTLAAPTPESFFSLTSLLGLLALESGSLSWVVVLGASFWFALATTFRANGTLLLGYIAFKLIPELRAGRPSSIPKLIVAGLICLSPSVLFQIWAYSRFCPSPGRPWCDRLVPSVYTFVQSHYWHVGPFRYWQLAQTPNFALAAPVLLLILYTVRIFYQQATWREVVASLVPTTTQVGTGRGLMWSSAPRATPYILHALALGVMLLIASHVQIALRLATPGGMPAVWWGAAHAVLSCPRWVRRLIVGYLAMQMCVGVVLYAGFYPPA